MQYRSLRTLRPLRRGVSETKKRIGSHWYIKKQRHRLKLLLQQLPNQLKSPAVRMILALKRINTPKCQNSMTNQ